MPAIPDQDFRDLGVLYVSTPEEAQGDLVHAERRIHALLDDLEPFIGRDRMVTIDNAFTNLVSAYQAVATARLIAACVAPAEGDHRVYVAPGKGGRS